ncbi:MAG: helix-turn-helix transcriptional regulator [Deltaproteobacteria bacterium]|nr:helix-turn-helix transcriptional regulator [Deltaproteobacteria bacterium]
MATANKKKSTRKPRTAKTEPVPSLQMALLSGLATMTGDAATSALKMFFDATGDPFGIGRLLTGPASPSRLTREAGNYIRELRELAGLTLGDLARALELRDSSLLEAVEAGTATLSFDLILRLSAIVARNDPLPTILQLTRTYNPSVARFLEDWGAGRLPLQVERERAFVNVLRGSDDARELSDEGFAKVLAFTKTAFELALHFAEEAERGRE